MGAMSSQINSIRIVYLTVYSSADQRPKLRVIGLCAGNSAVTVEFPAQMASNAENVSIDDVIMIPTRSRGTATQRTHDAIITSLLRQHDVATSFLAQ